MFENFPNFSDQPELPPSEQQLSKISDERRDKYQELFGSCPDQVAIKKTLIAVWPRGGVMEFNSPKLDMRVTITFGLSDLDMPAKEEFLEMNESVEDGRPNMKVYTRTISEPMPSVPGRAGYGYEVVCLSRDIKSSESLSDEGILLMEFASAQLGSIRSNSLDTLDGAEARIFTITNKDMEPEAYYMLARCWDLLPQEFNLSNGSVSLVSLIKLHPMEYQYALKNGPRALLAEFKNKGVLPVGDESRGPIV
jgi:hypothetical protein